MKIKIISPGKFENSPHLQMFNDYTKRLKSRVELIELEVKNGKNLELQKLKSEEEKLINKHLHPQKPNKNDPKSVILDENGLQLTSKQFAKFISDCQNNSESELCFVIGGAGGLSDEIKNQAKTKISFGLMTFPHLMVRVMLIEQIYRAFSIIENHPYHRQ